MANKIIQAINKMVEHPDRIGKIIDQDEEFYFLYMDKYKWSIQFDDDHKEYILTFFPGSGSLDSVVDNYDVPAVTYSTADFKTTEAHESFKDLYLLLKSKAYGIDEMLDDIIDPTPS